MSSNEMPFGGGRSISWSEGREDAADEIDSVSVRSRAEIDVSTAAMVIWF